MEEPMYYNMDFSEWNKVKHKLLIQFLRALRQAGYTYVQDPGRRVFLEKDEDSIKKIQDILDIWDAEGWELVSEEKPLL